MSKTNIPVVNTSFNSGKEVEVANIVATADGGKYEIDLDGLKAQKVLVVLTAAANDGLDYKLSAGGFSDAALGDLVIRVADGETFSAVVDSSRFKQTDGKIYLDADNVGAAATGTVTAYSLP